MRDIFDGAIVSLECLGHISVPDHRFLDGVTEAHRVKLSPNVDGPFTGAHWHCKERSDGAFSFASAGANFGFRYVDGRTQDGFVQLVGDTLPPFSGTAWEVREVSPGVVTIMSRGDFFNPEHRFLDGRTQDGSIGLAPHTDPPFTGTKWQTRLLADPSITVRTQREAIRSKLDVKGSGFTPNDDVRIVAEGIVGRQDHAPFPITSARVAPDGTFQALGEVGFFPTHPADVQVVIRAVDHRGVTDTGLSDGFHP